MANVNLRKGTLGGKGQANIYGKPVKTVYALVDLVDAEATKASTLATNDVLQAIALPPGTLVHSAGARVLEASNVAAIHFSIGNTGDTVKWVAASAGLTNVATWATPVGLSATTTLTLNQLIPALNITTDSVNLVLSTHSGTVSTAGIIAVWATISDMSEFAGANINTVSALAGVAAT